MRPWPEAWSSCPGSVREPGSRLQFLVSIAVLFLDDDVAHEEREHLGRHAPVALQQVAKLPERDDVLLPDAFFRRQPGGAAYFSASARRIVICTSETFANPGTNGLLYAIVRGSPVATHSGCPASHACSCLYPRSKVDVS